MTDVSIWNPNLDRPAKRLGEEIAKDDESKGPKPAKRPRGESDEQADGSWSCCTSLDKEPPIIDDDFPLSNEDNDGTGAEEDNDVEEDSDEEVSAPEEDYQDYSSPDYASDNNCCYVADGKFYGWCPCCVPDEVCKRCGNKNGYPPGEYDRYNPRECTSCDTTGVHKNGECVIAHIVKRLGN